MQYRLLSVNTSCPQCGERAETMDHLFRECPVTVEVWTTLSLQNIIMNQSMDFVQWLTLVFEQLTPCQGRLFCCALWDIWGDRNRRIHEEKVSNGKEITNFISNYITELIGFEKRKSVIITENKR